LWVRASEVKSAFAAGAQHSKEYCKGLDMQVMPDQQNALTAQGAGAQ
jgi:hypothetical protein